MKTTYTAPAISSVEDNEIVDLSSVALYLPQLRLVQLKGVPVRITIFKQSGYIELSSTEEEIDISKYYDCLKNVAQFFYGNAHLYGYVDNDNLSIYDIYTNDNFLSTRDMNYLEKEYHIPIAKPIAEGHFSFSYLIEVLNKKINGEGIDGSDFHLLPCMYLSDSRTYSASSPKIMTKIIIGEKKIDKPVSDIGKTKTPDISVGSLVEVEKPAKKVILPEVLTITTKDERTAIYKEVLRNVNSYVEKNKLKFTDKKMKWWKENGMRFAYMFAIHTLPKTRHIVYNYCKEFGSVMGYYGKTNVDKWAELFYYFFEDLYADTLLKNYKFDFDYTDPDNFAAIFKEELEEFDKFYVAENDAKDDWRYINSYPGVF